MAYVKAQIPSEVYHLTKEKNLDSILSDGKIRRFNDTECWFCENLTKMRAYMEQTVLCEGKPYYAVGGQLCRYPKFIPEDYAINGMLYVGYPDADFKPNPKLSGKRKPLSETCFDGAWDVPFGAEKGE